MHRLGLEYHKPEVIGRKLNTEKQQAFIAAYEKLQNSLGPDEAVLFVDAVHPTDAARPACCWALKEANLAIEQPSGRQRIKIHGAAHLETGETRMIEAETIDAASPIRLLDALEMLSPLLAVIHVFLDNARGARTSIASRSRPSTRDEVSSEAITGADYAHKYCFGNGSANPSVRCQSPMLRRTSCSPPARFG